MTFRSDWFVAAGRDDRILPVTRVVAVAVVAVLAFGFVSLLGFPGETGRHFSWRIGAQMTSMVLGSGYAAGAYFFARVAIGRRWHTVHTGFLPIGAFTVLMEAATSCTGRCSCTGRSGPVLAGYLLGDADPRARRLGAQPACRPRHHRASRRAAVAGARRSGRLGRGHAGDDLLPVPGAGQRRGRVAVAADAAHEPGARSLVRLGRRGGRARAGRPLELGPDPDRGHRRRLGAHAGGRRPHLERVGHRNGADLRHPGRARAGDRGDGRGPCATRPPGRPGPARRRFPACGDRGSPSCATGSCRARTGASRAGRSPCAAAFRRA